MSFVELLLKCEKAYDSDNYPMQFQELSQALKTLTIQNQKQFFDDAIMATEQSRTTDVPKAITIVQLTNYVLSNDPTMYLLNNQHYAKFVQTIAQTMDLFDVFGEVLSIMQEIPLLQAKFKEFEAFVQRTLVPSQMALVYPRLCEKCGEMTYMRHKCAYRQDVQGKEYFRSSWRTEEQWRQANEGFRFD